MLSSSCPAAENALVAPPAPFACGISRRLWPLCALLLSVAVVFAMPRGRIQMGASQLNGLVGSYVGHGNWMIIPEFSGSATFTNAGPTMVSVGASVNGASVPINGNTANLTSNGPTTGDGGNSASLGASCGIEGGNNSSGGAHINGAKITMVLEWMPEHDDIVFDPAPKSVSVQWRTSSNSYAMAYAPGETQTSSATTAANVNHAATGTSASATGPNGAEDIHSDLKVNPDFTAEVLSVSGGSAKKEFTVSIDCTDDAAVSLTVPQNSGTYNDAYGKCSVDFCVSGFNLSRFGGGGGGGNGSGGGGSPLGPLSGNNKTSSSDPTFTRWLPLAFSPQMNSQPFRYKAGALPAPWGNINCMYSPSLSQEPATPNSDLAGTVNIYGPLQSVYGGVNLGPPYVTKGVVNPPAFSIMDATGERLLFGLGLGPISDVHSTLGLGVNGVYKLTNAGPPGAMKERGTYTYTFLQTSAQNATPPALLTTQLIAIEDDLGNRQSLGYGANSFAVADSSSGRVLGFKTNANGYVISVDAPEAGANNGLHTHTALTWDGNGHCTGISVYDGATNLLLHTDTFAYGGPNGDSIVTQQQGLATANFAYVSDSTVLDPFGLPAPRLSSATYGDSGDSSSSDDGGSVAGTFSYTYGATSLGYNNWGVSARTNSVTDARGNVSYSRYELTGDVYGDIRALLNWGPAYANTPTNSNLTYTVYEPNLLQPQTITTYDPIVRSPGGGSPWVSYLDLLGNVTLTVDPMNHQWKYEYTPDGLNLTQITDPTNVMATFAYGERGNPTHLLTSAQSASGATTQIDYNTFGQPSAITTPAGSSASGQIEQTQFAYNATTGDLTGILGPTNDVLNVTGYSALGDPLGVAVYPDTGNPNTTQTPLTSGIVWNAAQQPVKATLANGMQSLNTWTNGALTRLQCLTPAAAGGSVLAQLDFSYDSRGRLYRTQDTLGTLAQYKYDKNGNVTQIIDGRGNITRFGYGSNNEPTGKLWPNGVTSTAIQYDAGGRVILTRDERGNVCTYFYDALSHLTDIVWPNNTAENTHYTYDDAGRLLTVKDASGSRTYKYNAVTGQLLTVSTVYSSLPAGSNTFTLVYSYNPDGSVASRGGSLGAARYRYDASGQLIALDDAWGNATTWTYDHIGRPTGQSTTSVGGATIATNYVWGVSGIQNDPSNAPAYLRQISESVNGQSVASYTLTHDWLGLLRQVSGSMAGGQSQSAQYAYDARGRLTSQQTQYTRPNLPNVTSMGAYTYDASGNLNAGGGGWQYNPNNQLTSAPATGDLPGATGLSYDASGNLTGLNGQVLTYDCWGNLTQIDNLPGGGSATYAYDSSGRRIRKSAGGQTTYFVYEGDALIGETDASGVVTRVYVWGALGLVSEHVGAGGGAFGLNNSGKGSNNSDKGGKSNGIVPGAVEFPDGRRGRYGVAGLCQAGGGSDAFHLYDTQGNTSALVNGAGVMAGGHGYYSPYGGDLGGQLNGSAFGWGGQGGGYRDLESGLVVGSSTAPYVPNAPMYTAPNPLNTTNPNQAMGGNPVSYGPGDDGDDGRDMSYAKSGLDAIRRGGGGPKGRQMARDFGNHCVNSIPFGGCLFAIAGMDIMGCKMDGWGRLGNMLTGLGSGMPALGHFGMLGGPTTEAIADSGGAAMRVRHHTDLEGLNSIKNDKAINPYRPAAPNAHPMDGVHVETSNGGGFGEAFGGNGANSRFSSRQGAYVEFDVYSSDGLRENPMHDNAGIIPTSNPLGIAGRNPKYRTDWIGRLKRFIGF